MERDRLSRVTATFYADAELTAGAEITLSDDAAHHARVRRLTADEPLRLTNGRGTIASAALIQLDKKGFRVVVGRPTPSAQRPTPVTLFVPVGDRDRTLWLAEKACELQVTHWVPVLWSRSKNVNPRAEGESFGAKARARMISALEQSGGAWLPEIAPQVNPGRVDDAVAGATRFLLDADGRPADPRDVGHGHIAIALGPEGGLTDEERAMMLGSGWTPWKIGSTTLRFETAALAAVSVVRALTTTRESHG